MSTIGTHLNWGASYLVNDVYLRFIKSRRQPAGAGRRLPGRHGHPHAALAGRDGVPQSVEQGWKLLIGLGAGTGAVFILRWYWWRINAWSEISAMARLVRDLGRLLHLLGVNAADTSSGDYALAMVVTVGVTDLGLAGGHLLTPPEPDARARALLPAGAAGGPGLAPGGRAAGLRRTTRFPAGPCPGSTGLREWPRSTRRCSGWARS